jgi:hypothetical protein
MFQQNNQIQNQKSISPAVLVYFFILVNQHFMVFIDIPKSII